MPTDTTTSQLVINKLSKQQYEDIQNPSNTELYLVPEEEEHKPICYPTTASEVKTTSMLVKSSVSDNGKILTENGFVYNTSGNPTVSDTKVICDLGVGFMEKTLKNLTTNTEYYIKSYGQNSSGLVYGSELVQRTLPSPIPVEYQLVEYLESSGTQYINTGYIPNINQTIECSVSFNSQTNQMYGCFYNTTPYERCHFGVYDNFIAIWFNTLGGRYASAYTNDFVTIKLSDSGMYINNEYLGRNNCIYPTIQFTLFARNNSNNNIDQYSSSKLAYFKIYSWNIPVKQMYPVYRISDNKPGMYDIVNGVFYTNQGTGEFVVGPDAQWTD